MVLSNLLTRVGRSIEHRFDRLTTSHRNHRLDSHFMRDKGRYLRRIHAAVGRGCDWFAPQPDVSMSVLWVANRSLVRGVDERFAFVHPKLERYKRTIRDPALRLFDKAYDPDNEPYCSLPDVMQVRPYYPVELLMIDTVWADVRPQPNILERLRAFDDNGGYGTTHIVVGGLILLANGGAPADATRELVHSTVETISAANDMTTRAEDIFAERIMALQWLERHDLVRPAWILRLLRAQQPDGGWKARNMLPIGQSNQHTTVIAMAALAEFRAWCLRSKA
jgi:hypothetical protein